MSSPSTPSQRTPAPCPRTDALTRAIRGLDDAEVRRRPVDLVQALTQVGRCYQQLGEAEAAEWYLQRALTWARTLGGVDASVDLLCDLADHAVALSERFGSDGARSRDHGFEATELARQCADPQWEVAVLVRISDVLDRCGDHDDAIALQLRAIELITTGTMTPPRPLQAAAPNSKM